MKQPRLSARLEGLRQRNTMHSENSSCLQLFIKVKKFSMSKLFFQINPRLTRFLIMKIKASNLVYTFIDKKFNYFVEYFHIYAF